MTTKTPLKKLRQLLQEKQEPFELENYLLERMYSKTSSNRGIGIACSSGKFGSIKKIKKAFVELSKILRITFKKLVFINEKLKFKDLDDNGWTFDVRRGKSCMRVEESDKFSATCSSTVFSSFSSRDNDETSALTRRDRYNSFTSDTSRAPEPSNLKVVQDMKTGKPSRIQARPKDSRLGNGGILNKKVPEDSILSATLWELLLYSEARDKTSDFETAELQELVTSNSAPQLLISKRILLQQTKQLLFNCVKEVVQTHCKHGKAVESDNLGRLICEKIKSLEEDGEQANISSLLNSDYLDSVAEWRDLEPQKQLIGTQIGEIILKEITNEIVTELTEDM